MPAWVTIAWLKLKIRAIRAQTLYYRTLMWLLGVDWADTKPERWR